MARVHLLLAALLAIACVSEAHICKKKGFRTYDIKNGNFVEIVKGNWINIAFNNAVKAAGARLKQDGVLKSGCKIGKTKKMVGCYKSWVQVNGRQYKGQYGFQYLVTFECPHKRHYHPETYLIDQYIYTNRDGSFWYPTEGCAWRLWKD